MWNNSTVITLKYSVSKLLTPEKSDNKEFELKFQAKLSNLKSLRGLFCWNINGNLLNRFCNRNVLNYLRWDLKVSWKINQIFWFLFCRSTSRYVFPSRFVEIRIFFYKRLLVPVSYLRFIHLIESKTEKFWHIICIQTLTYCF